MINRHNAYRILVAPSLVAASCLLLMGSTRCESTGNKKSDGPPDPEQLYSDAVAMLADQSPSKKLYEKVLTNFKQGCEPVQPGEDEEWRPFDPHALSCYNAGVTLSKLAQPKAAASYYRKALAIDSGLKSAVRNLTVALMAAGEPADALPIFEDYLKSNPKDAEMQNSYAGALGAAGRLDDALKAIQGLLYNDPKNVRAYKTMAKLYFDEGNYRMSQMASVNAAKLDENDSDIHNNMGISFLKEGKSAEAVAAFKKALELNPENFEANMNLGLIAVRAADYAQAAKCFQAVLKQQPGNAEATIGMAIAYRGNLEPDAAIEQYDAVLATDKCQQMALKNKAIVMGVFKQEHNAAKKLWEEYEACYPDDTSTVDYVAAIDTAIREEKEMQEQLKELERQMEELDKKAKLERVVLTNKMKRSEKVFQKYADVEQDPSWAEQLVVQVEACAFALESEDFFFMSEQRQYFDEYMCQYYEYALEAPCDEWMSDDPIELPEPPAEEGAEDAPAEDGTEAAPAEGETTEAAPAEDEATEAAPAEDEATEAAPAEGETTKAVPVEEEATEAAGEENGNPDDAPGSDSEGEAAPEGG